MSPGDEYNGWLKWVAAHGQSGAVTFPTRVGQEAVRLGLQILKGEPVARGLATLGVHRARGHRAARRGGSAGRLVGEHAAGGVEAQVLSAAARRRPGRHGKAGRASARPRRVPGLALPFLEIRGLSRRFPGVEALSDGGFRRRAWRGACARRGEWRRQVDAHEHPGGSAAGEQRRDPAGRRAFPAGLPARRASAGRRHRVPGAEPDPAALCGRERLSRSRACEPARRGRQQPAPRRDAQASGALPPPARGEAAVEDLRWRSSNWSRSPVRCRSTPRPDPGRAHRGALAA